MKLNHLRNKTLLHEMVSLSQRERALLSQVLWHLKEIDRRKLYCDLKYGSLFEYCVKELKYSEGQASRRVSACRLLKEVPEVIKDIESGDINLTQLGLVRNFCNEQGLHDPSEKKGIIDKVKGKTTRKTEEILWEMRKEDSPRKVTVVLNEETLIHLKKLQALKAHTYPDLDSLLMKMSEEFARLWDPTLVKKPRVAGEGNSRYVPTGVRAEVWKRDKGKCRNCGSTYALELDHIFPYAKGGKTKKENLRLLCRNCNQRKGIVDFRKTYAS